MTPPLDPGLPVRHIASTKVVAVRGSELEVRDDVVVGDGAEAVAGSTVSVHYVGVAFRSGEEFDASWNRGTPFEFTSISVSDGVSMAHAGMRMSLVSRELIADSIELTMRGHCYDAFVGIAGCDKSLPGVMMAQLRLNVPSVFMYGGSILPGKFKGQDVTVIDVFEAVGKHSAGNMSDEDLFALECVACPSAGACGGYSLMPGAPRGC